MDLATEDIGKSKSKEKVPKLLQIQSNFGTILVREAGLEPARA